MASDGITTTYRIIRIPRASPRLADLVTKSRKTRLYALETDPASFLAQHAVESALPLEVWSKRLSNPETTILACVATNDSSNPDDETALIEEEWVGFAAVRGPMEYDDYYPSPDMNLPVPENPREEARWHVYDLYTLPAHRGRGLAKRLMNSCILTAVEYTKALSVSSSPPPNPLQQARIRLFVNPKNTWVVKMYEGLGFRAAGKVTLDEGFRANALTESIPHNTRETEELMALWHTRFGLAMEQIVRVG